MAFSDRYRMLRPHHGPFISLTNAVPMEYFLTAAVVVGVVVGLWW